MYFLTMIARPQMKMDELYTSDNILCPQIEWVNGPQNGRYHLKPMIQPSMIKRLRAVCVMAENGPFLDFNVTYHIVLSHAVYPTDFLSNPASQIDTPEPEPATLIFFYPNIEPPHPPHESTRAPPPLSFPCLILPVSWAGTRSVLFG